MSDLHRTAITNMINASMAIKTPRAISGHVEVRPTLKHLAKTTDEI